jgi:hypothetical protein
VENNLPFPENGYDARMIAKAETPVAPSRPLSRAAMPLGCFGRRERMPRKARNERTVKSLKTNNSAKSLIRRRQ